VPAKFRILIIEDTPEKGEIVRNRIQLRIVDIDFQIEIVATLVEALRRLESTYFELVILDILIPAAGQNPSSEHSRTIIEQLGSGRLVMPACVIGLTAYEEEFKAEFQYYADNLFSIERYKADSDVWLNNIIHKIRFLHKWKSAYGRAASFSFDYDVVILTARFETEYKPILADLEWATGPNDDLSLYRNRKLKVGTIRIGEHLLRVAIYCIEEMGLSSAAAATSQLIAQFRPRILCMLGMCCGFRQEKCQNKSKLGDVIVVRESACWDEGKYAELDNASFFFNRAKTRVINDQLDRVISSLVESEMAQFKSEMKVVWDERKSKSLRKKFSKDSAQFPDVKYGLLVSGSSVIAHDVKGDEIITRFTSAIALEMEIYGAYAAVDKAVGAKPMVLGIKGVADFGDGAKHKEFQSLASRLSYCVAKTILNGFYSEFVAS
jgi:nucleoside phosphorylase/CheY-like chemotaxis protein